MILHFDEYQGHNKQYASNIILFEKMPAYLHEMTAEEISKILSPARSKSFNATKCSVLHYFSWLKATYGIDITELYIDVKKIKGNMVLDASKMFFKSINELLVEFNKNIVNDSSKDYDTLRVFFILQWYGIKVDEALTINLSDINGNVISIPNTDKKIILDDVSTDVVNDYCEKTGRHLYRGRDINLTYYDYTQHTLIRSIYQGAVKEATINNLRANFSKDTRFRTNNVLIAGGFNRLLQIEEANNINLAELDSAFIEEKKKCTGLKFTDFQRFKRDM